MPNAHVLIQQTVRNGEIPADQVTNSLYFISSSTGTSTEWQDLAQAVANVHFSAVGFGSSQPWQKFQGRGGVVKVYDMATPKPRPPLATVTHTPATWETVALAPRLICCCLSFYANRNLPHSRGRIYLGPFAASELAEMIPNNFLTSMMDYAIGLQGIASQGTGLWEHATHSTVTNQFLPVTNYWANNKWDVQHSRATKETSRLKHP